MLKKIFINPGENRVRAGWRILIMSVLVLTCLFLFSPLLLVLAFDSSNPSVFLLINAIYSASSFTIAIFISRRWIDRRSIKSLGLAASSEPFRKMGQDFLTGVVISGVMFILIFFLEWLLGWIRVEGTLLDMASFQENTSIIAGLSGLLMVFIAFLLVGWSEELLFRGYLLVNLREGTNLFWAVVLSSIFFSLSHVFNPNITWESVVGLAFSGLFFAFATIWSRGLWLPIGIHFGWNFIEGGILGFPVSGIVTTSLLKISQSGPPTFTGGDFGPEAGLILLPAIGLGFLMVYTIYSKRR